MFSPRKKHATAGPEKRKTGFTLIEVLVATAVMAIMVVMLGAVFQQASSSWDSGYVRAEGGMAVRAVVGSLTRDLATAVDARRYKKSWMINPESGETLSLTFLRLKDGAKDGKDVEEVTYSGGGTVKRNGVEIYKSREGGSANATFRFYVGAAPNQGSTSSGSRPFEGTSYFADDVAWTVPYVKVRCTLTRKGSLSGITVRSFGKDGVDAGIHGGGDDIVVR